MAALVIHGKGFEFAAQDRGLVFVQYAGSLAERLMRTDPAADFRQGTGLVIQVRGVGEASLLDQPHGGGDVVVRGAGQHAGRGIRAMDAARRLHHGAFGIELDDHIVEIAGALFGRAQIEVKERHVRPCLAVNGKRFTWE
jgi:hypothetical protein